MDTDLGLGLPASPRVRGRNRRRPSPPRHAHSAPRLSRKDSPAPDETTRLRLKSELIDFDLIKGSALFHTKPSSHDKKLVKEGFTRALLVPLHAKFWRQKPWVYETATALYALHAVAVGIYLFCPDAIVPLNGFEVAFPLGLLLFLAIGYGRVSSTLQAGDSDPALKILSPTKHPAPLHVPTSVADTATSSTTVGLGSEIAESENSDSTDSEEESGNSSSSSEDEAPTTEAMFEATANAQPSTSASGFSSMPTMTTPKPPTTPTNPLLPRTTSERDVGGRRVTVCVWDGGFPTKKAMSIAELRNTILAKVKATPPRMIYRKIAMLSAAALSTVPIALRVAIKCQAVDCLAVTEDPLQVIYTIVQFWRSITLRQLLVELQAFPLGASIIALSCMLSTYYMASIIFSALADAEVTYHRRFLYAKCFTALTSSRRSRLANLPHFRLKNVVNIRAWISLRGGRTWLKRQGRQRAADEIVSTAFLIILVLLVVMGMQAVSDSAGTFTANSVFHIEVAAWCMLSSIFLLRFMMLGSNINKKYQNTSLLLTEQMNVYLRLLTKPHKKEKLLVSNNVLKLASKLLKELNSPNKVSGLTMNPLLYNLTRVVVLSAFSSTASEFFGFKLKLWKLKA